MNEEITPTKPEVIDDAQLEEIAGGGDVGTVNNNSCNATLAATAVVLG